MAPAGELDITDRVSLKDRLGDALDESASVVLDLSRVTFIDSTVLSVVLQAHHDAQSRGSQLSVVCATPVVKKLFRITQLDQVLELHTDDPPSA